MTPLWSPAESGVKPWHSRVTRGDMVISQRSAETLKPDFAFLRAVEESSRQAVSSCYRCLKCSAGCPMAGVMDYPPDRLVRRIQLGLKDEVLRSSAIWLCSCCLTCSDRCPNGIDVARVIDTLKQMAVAERLPAGEPRIADFHRSFLAVVKQYGRMHEASLIVRLKLKSHDWFSDVGSGLILFLKGKIPPLPQRVRGGVEIFRLFQKSEQGGGRPTARGGVE